MKFTPMPYKVLVRVLDEKKEFAGIIIPDKKHKDQEPMLRAEVVSIGYGVYDVEEGDTILIQGYAGKWIDPGALDDKSMYRLMDETEMVALITTRKKNGY